jgi:hypothetical protein
MLAEVVLSEAIVSFAAATTFVAVAPYQQCEYSQTKRSDVKQFR